MVKFQFYIYGVGIDARPAADEGIVELHSKEC